jgi:hypothetical protein
MAAITRVYFSRMMHVSKETAEGNALPGVMPEDMIARLPIARRTVVLLLVALRNMLPYLPPSPLSTTHSLQIKPNI